LPASLIISRAVLILILVTGTFFLVPGNAANDRGPTQSSAIRSSLNWLVSNEKSDGSYGGSQISTPPAALAVWLNDSHSVKALASFSWLASQLDDSSSFAWGEADIPGQILYTLSASGNVGLLRNSSDFSQTTSSIDTAMALLGLAGTHAISASKEQDAIAYLLSLQNLDGSFNLTQTEATNHYETLGPESISATALAVLVLKGASYNASDIHVASALSFLTSVSSSNFTATHDNQGHVYAASLSALAFDAFGRPAQAEVAIAFILSQQNSDGGFRDIGRLSSGSNALDTGWTAIALEKVQPGPLFSSFLSPLVFVGVIILVGVVVVVGVVTVYVLLRRRTAKSTLSSGITLTISTH